jgi:hypothetical protein
MPLEPDITARIRKDFSHDEAEEAIELLTASGENGRLARCIVVGSDGKLQALRDLIEVAGRDYRDAIVAGEYDAGLQRIRDLTSSFLVDSPEAFWIAHVANALNAKGFTLQAIETRPATVGPFIYTSDFSEGVATFAGDTGPLRISKRDRKWKLDGDPAELELYGLARSIEDDSEFADEVSCYILAKQHSKRSSRLRDDSATFDA